MARRNPIAIDKLTSDLEDVLQSELQWFNSENASTLSFPDYDVEQKQRLVGALEGILMGGHDSLTTCNALETLRILSRDRQELEPFVSAALVREVVRHAGLEEEVCQYDVQGARVASGLAEASAVVLEAQKCLCNILYNSPRARDTVSASSTETAILGRIRQGSHLGEVLYFDLRLLFLLTALIPESRQRVKTQDGAALLTDLLCRPTDDRTCIETLKSLFNLVADKDEDAELSLHLVATLQRVLVQSEDEELTSHVVNLLSVLPREALAKLGEDVAPPLLQFLERRMEDPSPEQVSPILHALTEIGRANRPLRRLIKRQVLPPLGGEVMRLPEEGKSLRNRLVRLMTSSTGELGPLAAELLFMLCKENVTRLVKYSGYGNAAGLLARRGLLVGNPPRQDNSDSDSETEEYRQLERGVNPVTGRWEDTRPSPLEGLSDQQKEYEALQLVQLMHQLDRQGVIRPSRIGSDGRPAPVEHVLQLCEGVHTPRSESDSD